MDEKDVLEQEEFNLDDIIKEFSDAPAEKTEQPEIPQEQEETAQSEQEETPEAVAPVEETKIVPMDVTGDTIRIERIPEMQGKVRDAVTIDEEEPEAYVPEEPQTEPYSEEWEPEYEQPISEYIPQEPIAFRPKSRLREIKKKLVAGPEKQYYILSEQGVGKLQLAIFFSLLVVLISAAATAMYALGMVPENRLRLMVFSQFFAMLVSALLGSFQLVEGAADLAKGKFSLNTLLLFTFVLCCVDGILGLKDQRIPCCAAFSLQVLMSLWSAYQNRNTRLGQLDTMRKATRLDSISAVENYSGERKGLVRGLGEVDHFMDTYRDNPQRQKILSVYAMVALGVSVGAGVLAGILHGVTAGIQVAAVTSLAAMPASMFVIFSRPMAILERRLHAVGAVLCGWQGADGLTGDTLFPLEHNDLFPVGNVKMNGVKFFGARQPDQIIAYATAVIKADGGSLVPVFTQLLDSRSGMHFDPEEFSRYEGGIGAVVAEEPVLVGTLEFLKTMGVETPAGIRVNNAVCVAVDGELSGLFAVTYEKDRSAAAGIASLCGYRKLRPVMLGSDFVMTGDFLHERFGINSKKILFPEAEEALQMQEKTPQEDAKALALVTGEGLAPFAYAVTGARSLKTAITLGIVIHLIGGILGMLMMLVLAYLGETAFLTPANLFLYELIWMIPGLLVTEWTRSI